uniref:Uncharacterized protein n=1 Tax=Oryza meridionalis TaxID=40149 RepID=A0A0E0DUU6_9ORYZ
MASFHRPATASASAAASAAAGTNRYLVTKPSPSREGIFYWEVVVAALKSRGIGATSTPWIRLLLPGQTGDWVQKADGNRSDSVKNRGSDMAWK